MVCAKLEEESQVLRFVIISERDVVRVVPLDYVSLGTESGARGHGNGSDTVSVRVAGCRVAAQSVADQSLNREAIALGRIICKLIERLSCLSCLFSRELPA
jgi:hypothetical protein